MLDFQMVAVIRAKIITASVNRYWGFSKNGIHQFFVFFLIHLKVTFKKEGESLVEKFYVSFK